MEGLLALLCWLSRTDYKHPPTKKCSNKLTTQVTKSLHMVSKKIIVWLVLLSAAFLMNSCSIERTLAKEFIETRDSLSVLLLMPEYIFKSNLKSQDIDNFDQLDEFQQDSALFFNSLFLKEIDDSFLLSQFENGLSSGLQQYGITVFTENQLLDFMGLSSASYKVMIAQMEIEEDIYPYRAEAVFYDTVYYYEDFNLNRINLNTWFEVVRMNDPAADNHLLYSSHYAMDGLEGRFVNNVFTGDVRFHYNLSPVTMEDIYTLAFNLGKKYAGYLYDYFLNEYIYRNYPRGERPKAFYTYNPQTRSVSPAGNDRFIFMEK